MEKRIRKQHGAKLKTKVACEALRGDKTTNEIAAQYKVHPTQVSTWKKQLQQGLPEVFARKPATSAKSEAREGQLFEEIGRLKVELDWLKKKASSLG